MINVSFRLHNGSLVTRTYNTIIELQARLAYCEQLEADRQRYAPTDTGITSMNNIHEIEALKQANH